MSARCIAALAALLALAGCEGPPQPPAKVRAGGETFAVSDVSPIGGTRFVAISISRGEAGGGLLSPSSGTDLRNVAILDAATGVSRRLLPDNARRVRAVRWLTADDLLDSQPTVGNTPRAGARWYALEVERPGGGVDLVVGEIAGGASVVLARGLDGVDLLGMQDATHAVLVARQGGRLSWRLIDMTALRQVAQRGIAI